MKRTFRITQDFRIEHTMDELPAQLSLVDEREYKRCQYYYNDDLILTRIPEFDTEAEAQEIIDKIITNGERAQKRSDEYLKTFQI